MCAELMEKVHPKNLEKFQKETVTTLKLKCVHMRARSGIRDFGDSKHCLNRSKR